MAGQRKALEENGVWLMGPCEDDVVSQHFTVAVRCAKIPRFTDRCAKIPQPKTFRVKFPDSSTAVLPPEFEDSWEIEGNTHWKPVVEPTQQVVSCQVSHMFQ